MKAKGIDMECSFFKKLFLLSGVLFCTIVSYAQEIPVAPPKQTLPAAADLIKWHLPGYPVFDKNSIGNVLNWLHDAPAGKHGHVKVQKDGQLSFEDGTPANFWGTTTVYGMTFPEERSEIPLLADAIAARGYNMVRFHHNDIASNGLGYLQETPKSNHLLDKKGMDRLDFFVSELIKRGVYIYIDIVDYRTFKAEDGFEDYKELNKLGNNGWKGVFPHPKIVAAWKKAVTELLNHKNPYTGKTYGEDPAMVTIEIINENGPFWDWSFKVTPPILKWYDEEWNKWLLEKYKTREALDAAWTDSNGTKGLFTTEDPAKGNVFRPRFGKIDDWDRSYRSKTSGAARINDYNRYLSEIMINFYKLAKKEIRDLGFKGVVIGSHELRGPLNRYTEFKGTGTVAAHLYAPSLIAWRARPGSSGVSVTGVDVTATNWFSNFQRVKVQGAPAINGEWTVGAISYRADGNLAVAAGSAFQGLAQSAHFSYGHRWRKVKMSDCNDLYVYKHYIKKIALNFSNHHDITWMMINRICAPLFIRKDFKKPLHKIHIGYTNADIYEQNLHALGVSGGSGTIGGAANFLPLMHNLECKFFDDVYDGDADVVFMTGRSSSGDYSKAKHAVLVGDNPYCDPYHKKRDIGLPATKVHPGVKVVTLDKPMEFTCKWPWKEEKNLKFDSLEGAIEISSVPKGAQLIGKSSDGKYTLGWLDDRFLVLPNGKSFQNSVADQRWLYRLYLAACKRWKINTGKNSADSHMISSDTGEMVVDWGFGTLQIDTPKTQGFSGLMGWRKSNVTSSMECKTENPYANVMATATDNVPLNESKKILLVAVGRMQNTGEILGDNKAGQYTVVKTGTAPCLVEGIRGEVKIKNMHADKLQVLALDPTGKRQGKVDVKFDKGSLSFKLSPEWGTIWYEISIKDPSLVTMDRKTEWPLPKTESPIYPKPKFISLQQYFKLINSTSKGKKVKAIAEAKDYSRVELKSFKAGQKVYAYGNAKTSIILDPEKHNVFKIQFGKVDRQWFGGTWIDVSPSAGFESKDILGLGLHFKGDGTKPRDSNITVTTADGGKYKSANLNIIFEDDKWRDVVLKSESFSIDSGLMKKKPELVKSLPAKPDFSKIKRIDIVCVGPLMDQSSVGDIANVFLAVNKTAFKTAENPIRTKLAEPQVPVSRKIKIPFVQSAEIKADGIIDEKVWWQALGLSLNEETVPEWHFFGSHVVDGKRNKKQQADFWMLATEKGLALIAKVKTGNDDVIAEKEDWYMGDCVEVFTDVGNKGAKPTKQLFLAYKRSGANVPSSNGKDVKIGRAKLSDGYLLEALVPWETLGFSGIPDKEFGLEFQIDFGASGKGRVLQMCYGTGTNEAWIKSDQYLKVELKKALVK